MRVSVQRRSSAILFGATLAWGTSEARAETPPPVTTITWSAPHECPQEREVISTVERFLKQPLTIPREQTLTIHGKVTTRAPSGFTATLLVTSPRGNQKRLLSNDDCSRLTEAAALVSALAIDPKLPLPEPDEDQAPPLDSSAGPLESTARDEAFSPPRATPNESPVQRGEPAADSPSEQEGTSSSGTSPWRISAALVGLAQTGMLPGAAPGLGLRASIGRGPVRVTARGQYHFGRFSEVPGSAGLGVDIDLRSAALEICGLPLGEPGKSASPFLCFGPAIGDLRGAGTGLDNQRTEHARWSALVATLGLDVSASRSILAELGLALGRALETPRFGVNAGDRALTLFEPSSWTLEAFAGLGVFR
jgi:hypothetical protein